MTTLFTSDNLQSIFTFPFKDEKWKSKLAIFVAITFAGILIVPTFFLWGYIYELMRRIIVDRGEPTLPDWDDWGGYFTNGFKISCVIIIYSLPVMLLTFLPYLFLILPMAVGNSTFLDEPAFSLVFSILIMVFMTLGMLLGFISQFLLPVAVSHMIAKGETRAAFKIKEWWQIFRKNFGGFFLSFILVMGTMWILMIISQFLMMTIILCIAAPIAWSITYAYVGVIGSVLFGQAYNEGRMKLAEETGGTEIG